MTNRNMLYRDNVTYAVRGIHPMYKNVRVSVFYKDCLSIPFLAVHLDMYEATDKGMNNLIDILEKSPHNVDMSKVSCIQVLQKNIGTFDKTIEYIDLY